MKKLSDLEVGDVALRLLSGLIPMKLKITKINETEIICGDWRFSRVTGGEIDEDLGWDGVTRTGSYLENAKVK